jgi:hypothetical protein
MTTQRRKIRKLIQSYCDEYGVLFALQKEQPFCDALADAIIAELEPKKRRRTSAQADAAKLYHLAVAIAEVCAWDYEANKGRLFSEAKRLAKATPAPTPDKVREHYAPGGTWYTKDWRGREGREPPTPGQIRSTWAKLVGGASISAQQPGFGETVVPML